MSEHSLPEQRTEMPTAKRMQKIRSEGMVFHSREVEVVASLLGGYFILGWTWDWLFSDLKQVLIKSFSMIAQLDELNIGELRRGFIGLLVSLGPVVLVICGFIAALSMLAVGLQTQWNVKEKKIKFNWGFLNPIGGIRRIFSLSGLTNTLKAFLKLAVILPIGYFALKHYAADMIMLIHTSIEELLHYTGMALSQLFWKIMYVLILIAIFDWIWGKHLWLKQNRMTKEEVKDERKAQEGDEQTKKQIQNKGLSRIYQRIRQSVPQADVVITNPTHFAIALKYDRDNMRAPIVLAKGKGFLALRIRELARAAGIPIVERKPLARALYDSGEIGKEIPYELFRAVAEVIAYVYRLKKPYAALGSAQT